MGKGFGSYLIIACLALISIGLVLFGYRSLYNLPLPSVKDLKLQPEGPQQYELDKPKAIVFFDLLDPEMAPPETKEMVMFGYRAFCNTKENVPDFTGNTLNCNNCHFAGGNTFGGRNGGISIVGVSKKYPHYSKRAGKTITLTERIQGCFKRSMNGTPLPADSKEMKAFIAYMDWISSGVKSVDDMTWLGLNYLKSDHKPDPVNGAHVYMDNCAACHEPDGSGADDIPPLWGPNSFNDGAGMNQVKRLSAFVYWNMPFQNAVLTEEQALDVAAYVTQQKRPHYKKKS